MIKIFLFELIKGVIALLVSILLFTLLPLSIFICLFPIDIIVWIIVRRKWSPFSWMSLLAILYLVLTVSAFILIVNGNTALRFLLDFDNW